MQIFEQVILAINYALGPVLHATSSGISNALLSAGLI